MIGVNIRQTNQLASVTNLHLRCLPNDEFYTSKKSVYWIGTHEGKPVCFTMLTDVGHGIIFLSRSGVIPSYQGKGLHRRLIAVRENWCKKYGYKTIITYVKHENPQSFCSLIKCDYKIYTPEWQYGGFDVFYFIKKL